MKKITLISFALLFMISASFGQKKKQTETVAVFKWMTIEEAAALNKTHPKKIFIDVYTDWCGWCTKMVKETFSDSIIKQYMAENFYTVKLNAEQKDSIVFNGKTYRNPSANTPRSSHQLAISLLQGQMSYPSFIFLNEKLETLTMVKGYRTAKEFEPILHYYAENNKDKMTFDKYLETFKGSFK